MAIKVEIHNQQGEQMKTAVELNPQIFGVDPNPALLAQYARVYQSNQRQGTSKVKNRGEVSGGGRKPWRQKGTGRARQGSIRSPLWVHGGVVFGPVPRDWSLKMPVKMRRRALFSALSAKVPEGGIVILNKLALAEIKAQVLNRLLAGLCPEGNVLLVLAEPDENIILSARNLERVQTILARNLNAYAVLAADKLILTKESLEIIEKTFNVA